MSHLKTISVAHILVLLLVCACNNNEQAAHAGHDDAPHENDNHEHENTVSLTAEQMRSIHIKVGEIENKQLSTTLKANGYLRVLNQNRATATPLLGGVVKTIYVQTGNYIRKGEPVASITNTLFISMQEEYLSLMAKSELAALEYKRQEELSAGNATALKTLQASKADYTALKTKVSSLQKQLQMIGINTNQLSADNMQSSIQIYSPISGSVSEIMVNVGSYADANKALAEIIDHSSLHLDLYVYEKDLSKLKIGQTIHFTLTNNPGKEYDADIYAIGNTFESSTKAVAVHAAVKGDKTGLIDGMSITALVSLNNVGLEAIPTDAIVNHQGQDYIFMVVEKETKSHVHANGDSNHVHKQETQSSGNGLMFERIPIRKGSTDLGYSEITLLKDIPPHAKIVTNGAFFLMAKMTNQGEAHEH